MACVVIIPMACGSGDQDATPAKGPTKSNEERAKEAAECSAGQKARTEWLNKVTTLDGETSSPAQDVFRIGGKCGTKLMSRSLKCDENSVFHVYGDNPDLGGALKVGFTTLSCGEVVNLEVANWVDYPIVDIYHPSK